MKAICLNCTTEFNYTPSSCNGKYCNNICQQEHHFIVETKSRVERGEVWVNRTLRRYLQKIVGNCCKLCGNEGIHNNKPLILQVDHVDGNSDNNFPDNLRLLCPNCHSQTETWTARNKKSTKRNRYLQKYKARLV